MVSGNLPQTSRIVALVAFGFDHASDDEDVVATEALENCFVQGLRRRFEGKVGVFFGAESEVADVDAAGDSGVDFERAFDGEMGIGDEDRGLVEGAELEGAEFAPDFEAVEEHAVGASDQAGDQALDAGGADMVEEEPVEIAGGLADEEAGGEPEAVSPGCGGGVGAEQLDYLGWRADQIQHGILNNPQNHGGDAGDAAVAGSLVDGTECGTGHSSQYRACRVARPTETDNKLDVILRSHL